MPTIYCVVYWTNLCSSYQSTSQIYQQPGEDQLDLLAEILELIAHLCKNFQISALNMRFPLDKLFAFVVKAKTAWIYQHRFWSKQQAQSQFIKEIVDSCAATRQLHNKNNALHMVLHDNSIMTYVPFRQKQTKEKEKFARGLSNLQMIYE